ncbi:IclR family transcriptional regulator [Ruegeria atlantica]|uniref:Acetate operon repressor n=1 Tax=Ruegeria atlantica TaxID=81569 RepID=A0A0P1E2K3_9RHOB|nr:IclR family transcriptional regulator [Ruegeria atlantica]CUH42669.1 Acetate operon repressor [Ruegeria atlantica]
MNETKKPLRRGRPRLKANEEKAEVSLVVALDRGIQVLICLADRRCATLAELAKITAIPAATAHRLLTTLQQRGMVIHDAEKGKWRIGPQSYRIGSTFEEGSNLLEVAPAVMRLLSEETGETANLAVEEGGLLLFLVQVESENPIRASFKNGTAAHFHTSGVGKAIMAFMNEAALESFLTPQILVQQTPNSITDAQELKAELCKTRERGWALDDEERFLGMRCIAAPIFDSLGKVVAGVSVSGPIARFPDHKLEGLATLVVKAAATISDKLTHSSAGS